jgi:hypothetical protein
MPTVPMMVNPAGLNNGQMLPNAPQGFQFPNFGVPFPFQNLPAQLAASMQSPQGGQYGRFGASETRLPTQAQGNLPPPTTQGPPPGTPQLPGTISAGNLPPAGPATGYPGMGMPSTRGGSYEQMKAGTLGQIADMQRSRLPQQPSLQQFASTFNSLPTDAQKFVYWNSQPTKGMYDPFVNSLPNFRGWVNDMYNNQSYNGSPLSGLKWDSVLNRIRG